MLIPDHYQIHHMDLLPVPQGVLRVAHCGGLHVSALNTLVRALNTLAKLLGHRIRWDTETLGCDPSLSSIPSLEQRTLVDALEEVAAWMGAPGNEDELVVLFFDDQPNLATWVRASSHSYPRYFTSYLWTVGLSPQPRMLTFTA